MSRRRIHSEIKMARRRIAVVAFPVLFLTLGMASWAAQLSATNDGVTVDAGSQGKFTLTYPEWVAQQDDKRLKPIEKQVAPKRVILKYAGGGTVTVTIQDGQVVMDCKGLPAGVSKFRMDMLIDFGYADGGVWRIGGGKATAFPKTKPAKPFLYQGNARTLELTNSEGKKLTFQIPRYSFQQLQDNREWNWKIFAWMFLTPYDPQVSRYTLTIAEGAAAPGGKPLALVDRFGQDAKLAFPGKVTADSELKQDALRENTEAKAARPDPSRDVYGGLVGSGKTLGLKKTGFFHVQSRGGKWLLVDPDGNAVFHLGVCSFQPAEDYTYTQGRRQIYEWLPPYESEFKTAFHPEKYWSRDTFSFYVANVIRKYGEPYDRERWTTRVIPRVRRWGFNASGAFSGPTAAHQTARFPYVLSLPLSEWQLGRSLPGVRGLLDPFDPKTVAKIDALFAEHLPKRAKDPLLIGYFLANEQAFEDLSRVLPTLKAEQPAKVRLVQWLRDKYATIHAFNQAWGTKEGSFDRLSGMGLPVSTQAAADDLVAFTEVFLTEYFRLIADAFHKYDANHLLLGNRWQPGTANSEQLCRIAGRYVDVISVNYYAYAIDTEFLGRLHRWSGKKPMMLSEFYWASPSDTGLPGGKEVRSQRQRGLAYRQYVEQAAASGYVVGIEWFTLLDQARTGRFFERYNGEKGNTGLLSVTDRPYRDLLDEAAKTHRGVYDVLLGKREPFQYDDPLFASQGQAEQTVKIPRTAKPIQLDGQQSDWPGVPPDRISGKRLVEGADAGGVEAAFRLCWDDTQLYLLVDVTDPTPMKNEHKGDMLWSGDGVELFLGHEKLDQPGPLVFTDHQILLSAGKPDGQTQWYDAHAPRQYECRLVVVPRLDGAGYTLEAAIPFQALGFRPAEGTTLRFDLGIDNSLDGSSRACQLMWNGGARNSGDRTHWGRAVLTK